MELNKYTTNPSGGLDSTKDRLGATGVAIILHVALVILLLSAKYKIPGSAPPLLTASKIIYPDPIIHCPSTDRDFSKPSTAISMNLPVTVSWNASHISVPEISTGDVTGLDIFLASIPRIVYDRQQSPIPAGMRSRCSMSERMRRLRESGGDDRAERAVRKGLEFLASQQDQETGAIGNKYKAGMTGLSLLAYLGHCETPESPKFGDSVVKATLYLMDRALKNRGMMVTETEKGHHQVYEHAIATYALSELYTMTKASGREIPRLESILKKAVKVIVAAQDTGGGWSYGFDSEKGVEDMSVTGWNIQALKAAHSTGKDFTGVERSLDKAVGEYLPKIQDPKGAFKYRPGDENGKSTLTGAALLGMQIWNQTDSATYSKGLSFLNSAYPNPVPGNNFYAPYYNTQVYFLHGGKYWENYNSKFQPRLLDSQNKDGSWLDNSGSGHGAEDSQIMNTAWAILMLEVYYRYLPSTDKIIR